MGALISLSLLLFACLLDRSLGHPRIFADSLSLRMIAAFLIILGFGLHLWTFLTLTNWWKKDQLCKVGPFRYFRHPMYAAWITFIALGISLFLNSWILLFWYVLLQPIWHRLVVKEDALMADTFGGEYERYVEGKYRFIPKIF